jgi:hypothetical protein
MAGRGWVFQADHDGINQIARQPEMRAALAEVAVKAKAIAVAMSEDFRDCGDYIRGFDIDDTTIDWVGEYPGRRGCARLVNHSDHAAAVEWGSERNHHPHHVLTRTLAALDA